MRPPYQYASFVQDTITDPRQIPDVRVFVGFLGTSSRSTSNAVTDLIVANAETTSARVADAQERVKGMRAVAEAARNAVAAAAGGGGGAANAATAVAAAAKGAVPAAAGAEQDGANIVDAAAAGSVAAAGGRANEAEAAEFVARAAEAAVVPDDAMWDALSRLRSVNEARRERWLRLYFTLDFKEYVDVREADIVYNESTSSALLQRQASILWVRSDAEIWYVRTHSQPVQASDFLRGSLTQGQQPVVRPVLARDIGIQDDPPSWSGPC